MSVAEILDQLAKETAPTVMICTHGLTDNDRGQLCYAAYLAGWMPRNDYDPIDNPDRIIYTFKRIFVDDRLGGDS
jgi:hypothetical protein